MNRTLRVAVLAAPLAIGLGAVAHADAVARAKAYLGQGKPRDAQLVLRSDLRRHPTDGAANFMLAKLDLELGSAVSAEREAKAARAAHYQPDRALTLLLDSYLAQQRYVDLLHDFPLGTAGGETAARIALGRAAAEQMLNQGDRATAELKKAETFDDKLPAVWLARANAARARGDAAAAAHDLAQAQALDPNGADVALSTAHAALAADKPKEAIATLNALLARAPSNMAARVVLADALVASGQAALAQAEITKILKITPGAVGALYLQAGLDVHQQKWKPAQEVLQRLSPVMKDLPGAYFLQAETLFHLGEFGAAQQDAQHYVARVPADPRGRRLLAALALQNGHPHLALSTLQAAGKSGQSDFGMTMLTGTAYQATGNLAQAKAAYQRAAALAPTSPVPPVRLAGIDLASGNPQNAVAHLQKAAALAPSDPGIETALAQAAIEAGNHSAARAAIARLKRLNRPQVAALLAAQVDLADFNLPGAKADYREALKADPHDAQALLGLAHVALLDGKTAEATSLTEKVVKIDPANQAAVSTLAVLLASSKDFTRTSAVLEAAHKAAPQNPVFVADLASLDIRLKKLDDAQAMLAGVSPALQDNPMILAARAQVALARHDAPGAKTDLQALIQHEPHNADAILRLAQLDAASKDIPGAQAVLAQGLATSPHDLTLLQASVGLALKQGGMAAGLARAKTLAANPAHQPEATVLAGRLYIANHQPKHAVAAFQSADQSTPSALAAIDLAEAQASTGQSRQAAATLHDAIGRFGATDALENAAGQVALSSGDLDGASRHYRAALAKAPNDVLALNNLAWIAGRQGKPDAAGLAARAYAINPNPQIADTLGWILARQSKTKEAVVLLHQAHQGMPTDPAVAYHYASVLAQSGDKAKAASILTPILAGKTSFPDRAAAEKLDASLGKS